MNRIKSFIAISAFTLLVLGLPTLASAQWRDRNDDYYGNARYGRNIRGTVESLRNRARNFERQVDRIDDRRDDRQNDSGWWGNRRNGNYDRYDQLDSLAQQFRRATENLRNEYGQGRNLNNSRDEAQRVLGIGSQIEQVIYNSRNRNGAGRNVENDWNQIRRDLRIISDAYGLNYNNGGYRNDNWHNRLPWPF